jgi:hypothetical protein
VTLAGAGPETLPRLVRASIDAVLPCRGPGGRFPLGVCPGGGEFCPRPLCDGHARQWAFKRGLEVPGVRIAMARIRQAVPR